MKHRITKIVSVMLAVVMLFSILPTAVFADDGNETAPLAEETIEETARTTSIEEEIMPVVEIDDSTLLLDNEEIEPDEEIREDTEEVSEDQTAFSPNFFSIMLMGSMPAPETVAAIGDVEYPSLQDAFAAAEDGETITLLKDLTFTFADDEFIDIAGKSVTMDFNGFGVSVNDHLFQIESGAGLTLLNAKLTATIDDVIDYNYGTVIVGGTNTAQITVCDNFMEENYGVVEISNTVFSNSYGIIYYNYGNASMENVSATLDDSVISSNYGTAVFTNMTVDAYYAFPVEDQYTDSVEDYGIPSVVVNGGTFTGSYFNCCMYGSAEINNATITAEDGMNLYYDSSYDVKTVVTVNDCVFDVTNDDVFESFGDDIVLIIKGGTYTSEYGSIIYGVYDNARVELQSGNFTAIDDVINYLDDNATVIISDGTYVTDDTIIEQTDTDTTLEIHGGTFTCQNYAIDDISGKLVITDGTITSKAKTAVYISQGETEISGGSFTSLGDGYSALYIDSDSEVLLSGGIFTAGGDVCAFEGAVIDDGITGLTIADEYYADPKDWLTTQAGVIKIMPNIITFTYYSEGELYIKSAEMYSKQVFPANPVSSAGYDFLYWETADHIYVDDLAKLMSDTSLYAVFSDRTYTVTFVDNGRRTDVIVPVATSFKDVPGFVRGIDDGFMFWENNGNEIEVEKKIYSDIEITANYGGLVTNYNELVNAIKNHIPRIVFGADIEVEDTLVIDYDCIIYGNGFGLIRPDDFLGILLTVDGVVGGEEEPGVEADGCSVTVKNTLIDGRNVEAEAPAVFVGPEFSAFHIDNCTITNCNNTTVLSQNPDEENGAAISIMPPYNSQKHGEVIISNSKICGNHTVNSGAAVFVSSTFEGELEISNTEICHNSADVEGGGICIELGHKNNSIVWVLSDVDLHDNVARDGGAILLSACNLHTNNVNIYDNQAMYGGGVSFIPRMSQKYDEPDLLVDLTGVNFYRNFASGADGYFPSYGTDSYGDDVCYHNNYISYRVAMIILPESMNGQPYASLKTNEERTVCDVKPFTDEVGNDEPIPDNVTIPFFAWYNDGKYRLRGTGLVKPRFISQADSEKICEENDNLDIINPLTSIHAPVYKTFSGSQGLKAEYNGLLLKYVANNETDEQQYDSKAYLKDSTVIVRDNDTDIGFKYDHHKFIGWNTERDGSGMSLNDSFIITENTILYAQWELEQYVVTYAVKGDPIYGTPTDGTAPIDENNSYLYLDQVTVKNNRTTTWTTSNGKEDGIIGTWVFTPWDKEDFRITEDTEIHGSWKFIPDSVGNLTIKKTVTGDKGDKTKYFTFTVVFNVEGSYSYTGSKSGVIKSGDIILLKHGESVTICDLPAGIMYSVTESDNTGYRVHASGDSGTIIANTTAIAAFTNDKRTVPETGENSNLSFGYGVIGMSVLGILLTVLLERKRRKKAI